MAFTPRELELQSNTDVLGYIQARNAERTAQAKAEGWTFWMNTSEMLAELYTNVYNLEHSLACGSYSDFHREVYGCRPAAGFSKLTLEQLEDAINELSERC